MHSELNQTVNSVRMVKVAGMGRGRSVTGRPVSARLWHGAAGRVRLGVAAALLLVPPGGAQSGLQSPRAPSAPVPPSVGGMIGDTSDEDSVEAQKRLKAINAERQKSLVADTNKLFKLATELNAELAGEHSESFNPDQLRKVAEIEKLAHSVKEKMGLSVKGMPVFVPLPVRVQ